MGPISLRHASATLGVLVLLSPVTSGLAAATEHEPPLAGQDPGPKATLTISGIRDAALVGTLACESAAKMYVSASVSQQAEPLLVAGSSHEEVQCDVDPIPLTLPLGGQGVLVPGEVSYHVRAHTGSHDRWIDRAEGELSLTGTVDMGRSPDDGGPLEITVDPVAGISDAGPVAHGTVSCDEPNYLFVSVSGRQQAGPHHLQLEGSRLIWCDEGGVAAFAVPFATNIRGELVPGPATVTIAAWTDLNIFPPDFPVFDKPDLTYKTITMTLQNHTPEPDFGATPQPGSPVTIGSVTRISDGMLVVQTSLEACGPGTMFHLSASVRPPSARYQDRWWNPMEYSSGSSRTMRCTGEPIVAFVGMREVLESDDVVVSAYMSTPPGAQSPDTWWNEAAMTVSTK